MSLWRDIRDAYREMPVSWKWVLWLLVFSQVPLVYLVMNRLFVGFEIDRAPYALLHVIERVRVGEPIYVPFTAEQTSLTYMPFYMWLNGMLWKLFGSHLVMTRLTSLVPAILAACGIAALIWKGTAKNLLFSLAGAAFFLLTYSWDSPWMLSIQVDALHVALAVWGLYFLAPERKTWRIMLSSILLSLSFLTKQTGLAYLVAGLVYLLLADRKYWKSYIFPAVALCGFVMFYTNTVSEGEFWRQCFSDAGAAPWVPARIWNEVLFPDLLGRYGMMSLFALVFLFGFERFEWKHFIRIEFVLAGAGVAVALIAQPKLGSGMAQALVAYAGLSVCGMIGLDRLAAKAGAPWRGTVPSIAVIIQALVLALPLVGSYRFFLVDAFDRAKFAQLGEYFSRGRTCVLYYAYLPKQFGQPGIGQFGEERSMWNNGRIDYSRKPDHINGVFRDKVFDYVIVGAYSPQQDPTVQAVLQNYEPFARIPAHPQGVRGGNLRYEYIVCRPKQPQPMGQSFMR